MKSYLALLIAVLSLSSSSPDGRAAIKQNLQVLSLCNLTDNWKEYNRHKVRVRAIFVSGAEQTWLYDPACIEGEALTSVNFREHARGATKTLDRIVAKGGRAWVILEGVFYGPEPYKNVDYKLPAPIRERLEKSPRRYGHMDSFETMLEVTRVIEATEVPDDVPADKH